MQLLFQPTPSSNYNQLSTTMDSPEFSADKSPRRELQGPRPAPLKVRKDSHKIRKPPVAPQPQHPQQPAQHHHRPPVIIYTVSPKVIHTNPNDFMTLVQRLTGSSASTSSSLSSFQDNSGGLSPAARFASLEKTKSPKVNAQQSEDVHIIEGVDINTTTGFFPGILSPGPGSLPPIPPNFFSPPSDQNNPLGFFHDLSPVLHSNRNYLEGSFMPSPSNFIYSQITSPTPSPDIFNNFFDL
ncbi:hypothetical protein LguiA_004294 [Lonicera macranthoides]